jgi:CDP-glucose 4,6-dehydratase
VVTARAGNVIGGGDWSEDRLVPDIWRASQSGETLVLRHPETTRPWQHVTEPLAGYLRYIEAAAQGAAPPPALNFGPEPGDVLNVATLATAMQHAVGAKPGWSVAKDPGPAEMASLALDSALAAKTIRWRSRLRSSDAIIWTAEWYGRLARGEDARSLCFEQLTRYEALK